ncbi:MAG TPA: ABC transporter ATP-binding protein [Chloroflexia bacterium]|nr:ABC transporter ATP-binding protein [Chloroflexia bacterium]
MARETERSSAIGSESGNGSLPAWNGTAQSDIVLTSRQSPLPSARTKVIKFSNVSKRFTLHHERARSFQDLVVSLFGLRTPSKRGVALPRPAREAFWALRDVSFGIYAGEVVGIIGENGSGKSTTLKLISRILEPTSGSVSVKGKVSALLELGTGFHPELSGRENIFLNGSLLGMSRKEMAERYEEIVDFAEIAEFIDTPIKHYSSGMVMRLGFAVSIHVDPDILLTDEVLAVGDEAFQRKCLDYIATLRRRGVTILFVSHALEAVRSLCRRVIWLDHGKMIADGPAGEVIDRYLTYENAKHAERVRTESRGDTRPNVAAPQPMESVEVHEHQKEEEADASSESANERRIPDTPGSRWTTGDIQITGVEFVDASGEASSLFHTGQPFTIRIKYEAKKRLEKPVFGLALYTENGTHINGPNTLFSGLEIPAIEGTGHVDYHIEELPLLTGRYSVTVAVTGPDTTDIYDHQHQAYSFVVQPTPGLPERYGLFYMPAKWSFWPDDGRRTTDDGRWTMDDRR